MPQVGSSQPQKFTIQQAKKKKQILKCASCIGIFSGDQIGPLLIYQCTVLKSRYINFNKFTKQTFGFNVRKTSKLCQNLNSMQILVARLPPPPPNPVLIMAGF